jgi:hypothetical protein
MSGIDGYVFVNRKSKPHLRKRAKDSGAAAEELHPNKLRSRIQFARSAWVNYGKKYPEFIDSIRNDLTDATIRQPEPTPVITVRERAALMAEAAQKGADPRVVDQITILRPPSPMEILMPELRRSTESRRRAALSIIFPFAR